MNRLSVVGIIPAIFVVHTAWAVQSQTARPAAALRMTPVKGDLHVIAGDGLLLSRGPGHAHRRPVHRLEQARCADRADYVQGGSLIEWSRTLERTLQVDFDTVIPGHGPVTTKADLARFAEAATAMRTRLPGLVRSGTTRGDILKVLEVDYGWRSTGCPPPPQMTPGCLQHQQADALIAELK